MKRHNLRIPLDTHKGLSEKAVKNEQSIQELITLYLQDYLNGVIIINNQLLSESLHSEFKQFSLRLEVSLNEKLIQKAQEVKLSTHDLIIAILISATNCEIPSNTVINHRQKTDKGSDCIEQDKLAIIYQHWLPYYGRDYMEQLLKHIKKNSFLIEYWLPYQNREELQSIFYQVYTSDESFYWDFYNGGYMVKKPGEKIIPSNKIPSSEAIYMGPWKLEIALCLITGNLDYSSIFQSSEGFAYGS